jgi:hypothetical protein
VVFREQLIIVQRDPAQRDPYRMIGRLLAVDGWGTMATCFVIVGFGAKTDFRPNPRRVLNPSVTCEDIIKPSVERVDLD